MNIDFDALLGLHGFETFTMKYIESVEMQFTIDDVM